MTGYELSKDWFNYSFENPELVRPNHTALYFFIIEHCNRLGWKKKFGLPTEMAKEAIGIRSYNTYIDTLKDLIDWKFITLIEKSKNQYSSNIISITKLDQENGVSNYDKALDKAQIKHAIKQGIKQGESTQQSIDSIIKLITDNLKPIEKNFDKFEKFVLDIENFKFEPSLHSQIKGQFIDWYKAHKNIDYYWQAKDAGALKNIIDKLKARAKDKGKTENIDTIKNMFMKVLEYLETESAKKERWLWENLTIANINGQWQSIIDRGQKK
jgi:ribosomal protein S15P/S13E